MGTRKARDESESTHKARDDSESGSTRKARNESESGFNRKARDESESGSTRKARDESESGSSCNARDESESGSTRNARDESESDKIEPESNLTMWIAIAVTLGILILIIAVVYCCWPKTPTERMRDIEMGLPSRLSAHPLSRHRRMSRRQSRRHR